MSKTPPYTKKLSKASRIALLEALNEIAIEEHSDTAVWARITREGEIKFSYAPAGCKRSDVSRDDFLTQFDSPVLAGKILRFVEQGYIG